MDLSPLILDHHTRVHSDQFLEISSLQGVNWPSNEQHIEWGKSAIQKCDNPRGI